jgi:hypothetical protein
MFSVIEEAPFREVHIRVLPGLPHAYTLAVSRTEFSRASGWSFHVGTK